MVIPVRKVITIRAFLPGGVLERHNQAVMDLGIEVLALPLERATESDRLNEQVAQVGILLYLKG